MERNKELKGFSQKLRKEMTKEVSLLWYRFLRKCPVRFRRQYIIGNYIVDFFCHEAKLVIELDGSQHCEAEAVQYDQNRTQYLESQGLKVLRFSNLDILRHFAAVCDTIDAAVQSRL